MSFYYDIWKAEFLLRNNLDEAYFDEHISDITPSSHCWNSGITVRVWYLVTIGWATARVSDKFLVNWNSSDTSYQYLEIPRDEFLTREHIQVLLEYDVHDSAIGPVLPVDDITYDTCEDAVDAFQEVVGYDRIAPYHLSYHVPGKLPRKDGHPYFLGSGIYDEDNNECFSGYFNLITGHGEAWSTACVIYD